MKDKYRDLLSAFGDNGFESVKVVPFKHVRKVFTPRRKQILKALQSQEFRSMRELAQELGMDSSDVRKDLLELEELGVVELVDGEKYGQSTRKPVLAAELVVPEPLVKDTAE